MATQRNYVRKQNKTVTAKKLIFRQVLIAEEMVQKLSKNRQRGSVL